MYNDSNSYTCYSSYHSLVLNVSMTEISQALLHFYSSSAYQINIHAPST